MPRPAQWLTGPGGAAVVNQEDLQEAALPFSGIKSPVGVAVQNETVYITDGLGEQVLTLADLSHQEQLPFKELAFPDGVAVDTAGTVYVTDYAGGRVVKLPSASASQTELSQFVGLTTPVGVAVDNLETVHVTDTRTNRVLKLPKGATQSTDLPFAGLTYPRGVAAEGDAGEETPFGRYRLLKLLGQGGMGRCGALATP